MPKQPLAPIPAEKVHDEHSRAMQTALQENGFFTRELEPRWLGELAAVDVFARSHAWEVVERMRIDA